MVAYLEERLFLIWVKGEGNTCLADSRLSTLDLYLQRDLADRQWGVEMIHL